jgi:hypothetical protein
MGAELTNAKLIEMMRKAGITEVSSTIAKNNNGLHGLARFVQVVRDEYENEMDALGMAALREAAKQSKWMPPEYVEDDWFSDVCAFLRDRGDERLLMYPTHTDHLAGQLVTLGVGDGSGGLFVHGPYDAVKRVQRHMLTTVAREERGPLLMAMAHLKGRLEEMVEKGDCSASEASVLGALLDEELAEAAPAISPLTYATLEKDGKVSITCLPLGSLPRWFQERAWAVEVARVAKRRVDEGHIY